MIRRPGRQSVQKLYTQETDRNFISVNHTMPMNEAEISQNIHENMNRTNNDMHQLGSSNTSFANNLQFSSERPSVNMTLQSRLSALINPKTRSSMNSGLIVFKKPNKDYEKRSTQMVFDELKMDKTHTR